MTDNQKINELLETCETERVTTMGRVGILITKLETGYIFTSSIITNGEEQLDEVWLDNALEKKQREYLTRLVHRGTV